MNVSYQQNIRGAVDQYSWLQIENDRLPDCQPLEGCKDTVEICDEEIRYPAFGSGAAGRQRRMGQAIGRP